MEMITERPVLMDCDECGKHVQKLMLLGNDVHYEREPAFWVCLDCLKRAVELMEDK